MGGGVMPIQRKPGPRDDMGSADSVLVWKNVGLNVGDFTRAE